jgi:hypothetical protein
MGMAVFFVRSLYPGMRRLRLMRPFPHSLFNPMMTDSLDLPTQPAFSNLHRHNR